MPFPWKKNRVTRISQIVADLQSPKHGGSLVVETGFPTSLIDLFVKNRGRFRKPRAKKRARVEIFDPLAQPPPPVPPPTPAPSNPSHCKALSTGSVISESPSLSAVVREYVLADGEVAGTIRFDESNPRSLMTVSSGSGSSEVPSSRQVVGEDALGDGGAAGTVRVDECVDGSGPSMVLAVVLKMFVVVVLTMSVRKLTTGITMSAFVLLFLECVGKRLVSCFKHCSSANIAFKSLSERVSNSVLFKSLASVFNKRKDLEGSESVIVQESAIYSELGSANLSSYEEIEIVETKSETDIHIEETNYLKLNINQKWEDSKCKAISMEQCEISECKTKGKFKSKVKKLVPKKLRNKRKEKEKKSKGKEVGEEDKSGRFAMEEDIVKEEQKEYNKDRSVLLVSNELEFVGEENEVNHGITCSRELSLALAKEERTDSNRNGISSGYMILLVIALAGLVGGRLLAMILTMGWFLMLKVAKTQVRSLNVRIIKCCSITISW